MKTRLLTLLALALWLQPSTLAMADEQSDLSALVADEAVQKKVIDMAATSDVMTIGSCPDAKLSLQNDYSVLRLATGGEGGGQLVLKMAVQEEGCDVDHVLNVLLWKDPESGEANVGNMLPGTSRAEPTLQKDSLEYAAMAASIPEDNCEKAWVDNTEFLNLTAETQEGAKSEPWDEKWTLISCTKKAEVLMHFIPDKTGTTIAASSADTKFTPIK